MCGQCDAIGAGYTTGNTYPANLPRRHEPGEWGIHKRLEACTQAEVDEGKAQLSSLLLQISDRHTLSLILQNNFLLSVVSFPALLIP